MSTNLSSIQPSSDGHGSDGHGASLPFPRRPVAPASQPDASPQADPGQRLIIEEGVRGELVYTVIDRASGAVVARTSREEVAQMSARPDYAAGALIRAKA